MSVKPLSLIALISIVPVAVLTVLAVRALSLENDALSVRHDRLTKQRIDAAATLIGARLENLGSEVLARTRAEYAAGGVKALSKLTRKRVFTYAYVSKYGEQIYAATALEHQYDSVRLLQDRAYDLVSKLTTSNPVAETMIPLAGGYTLLRCSKDIGELDICAAVDQNTFMRALRSGLGPVARSAGLQDVALIDQKGTLIGPEQKPGQKVDWQPLSGLLKGWQLRITEKATARTFLQSTRFLYLVAAALIAGWLAMTWLLHRSIVLREEAAAARASVIGQLAHELRTPLANLRLHTDLLNRNAADAAAVSRYGGVLDGEIDRLASLAENAIAVARGAMAHAKLETAVPDESLRTLLSRFKPTLADAGCTIKLTDNAGRACRFDKTSWERCIVNLIDNARKYAPGSEITLISSQTSDTLRLEVSDQGPGIATDQRNKIFEPLHRGAPTEASGFGLGLAAVRALARQNGGNCQLEPTTNGAKFVLTMQTHPANGPSQDTTPC